MIREALKERIRDLDLTQKQVSKAMGEYEQNLSSFITGLRSYPYNKFIDLLTLLGLSIGLKCGYVGNYPPEEIKAALRDAIESSGALRRDVAAKSGINESTLSSFLTGKRQISVATLEKLMQTLGLGLVCYGEPKIYSQGMPKQSELWEEQTVGMKES